MKYWRHTLENLSSLYSVSKVLCYYIFIEDDNEWKSNINIITDILIWIIDHKRGIKNYILFICGYCHAISLYVIHFLIQFNCIISSAMSWWKLTFTMNISNGRFYGTKTNFSLLYFYIGWFKYVSAVTYVHPVLHLIYECTSLIKTWK